VDVHTPENDQLYRSHDRKEIRKLEIYELRSATNTALNEAGQVAQ
jgi:hypothetical protein